jgi:3-hydroxyisobutyrate dehydrogenase-like beta-hydroxyacid dehydrogenase
LESDVNPIRRVALIGFGEVGQILAEDLLAQGVSELSAFDPKFASSETSPAKALARIAVVPAATAFEAVRDKQLIISAVTAANAVAAAQSVVPGLTADAFFLDLNSVSPHTKQAASAIIERGGGRYVEASVMSPVPPRRIASPILLGGPHAGPFLEAASGLGFNARVFGADIGQASAVKMCRSIVVKGLEALLTECLVTARGYRVEDEVLDSLRDLLPIESWHPLAEYMIKRSLLHGIRRAEEMREAAMTVTESGVNPLMTEATVARQVWAGSQTHAVGDGALSDILDMLRGERSKKENIAS